MADKPIVGFVGKPFKDFIVWLHDNGYEVHLFHDKTETYPPSLYISQQFAIDFSSKQNCFHDVSKHRSHPNFLVNTYENSVLQKAWLAEFYRVPGLSEQSARFSTDKFLMRTQFQQYCPQYTPRFKLVSNWSDVELFLTQSGIRFPIILKPTNLYKSLLVTKNDSHEELRKNFEEGLKSIRTIYDKEHVRFETRFIVEEYLDGPSFSLEVYTDKEGNTMPISSAVDLVMGRDLGEQDNYNYSRKLPSVLSQTEQKEIQEVAMAGVKALKLTSSPAHVELVKTKTGFKLIEIGARTGGYRPRMYQLAFGLNVFQAEVETAHGKLPTFTLQKNNFCAVYELFSQKEGFFKEITHLEQLKKLKSVYYINQKASTKTMVGPAKKGYRFALLVILAAQNKQEFFSDTAFLENQVKVQVY